ncbi:MAG: NAD-dependent epimerase/dehydratase family protein [Actinomycetota bacterium]|nr:NAD-dependent epimerase/dehydratase family protein [Actinomycetota bacterium]
MDLLVLGGTAWLGHQIASEAAQRGHTVTCLARGQSGPCPPETRFIAADRDRDDAYDEVTGQQWDAVIDVARQPGQVRNAVRALEPVSSRYLFVSSANVYASQRERGQDEDAAVLPALVADVMDSMQDYGAAKVACEQAVVAAFGPSRSLIARAGLIGGPGDESGRSGYWPWRFAHPCNPAGAVLLPDDPDVPTALIDVRDLAGWLVSCAETGVAGIFNAAGAPCSLTDHLAVAREVAGHDGPVTNAWPDWLTEHGVQMWMGPSSLPLWIDDPDWYGLADHASARAFAAGLVTRPLRETLLDVLAWEDARPEPGLHGAGLADDEEHELLRQLGLH